jgi:hypothetical protein
MKVSRFACAFFVLTVMAVVAGSAVAQTPPPLTVLHWGESQIDEDGNLRYRVTASASGISWDASIELYKEADYLQLWAEIKGGPAANPVDTFVLVKSKAAYNRYGQPATYISGTSPRVKLPPGTYIYTLYVVLSNSPSDFNLMVAASGPHVVGTVTLP